jgi:hypothetical protein
MTSSGDFTVTTATARANWLYYRNSVVTPFNLLKQQANWTHQLQNGGVVTAVSGSALADTNPPSKKVSGAIGAVLTTAEDPNGGPYRAYTAAIAPFVDAKGDLVATGGWIEQPYPSEPNWLAVWSFVKNNLATTPSGMYNRAHYHLTKDVFLYLGNISASQRVYAIKFILAQHVDTGTGALIPGDNGSPAADGTFGLVTIQPSDAFLNGTGDLLLTPLSHVASQGFENIVCSLIFMEILLRFIEAQDVGGSYAYFGGVTVRARSANYPEIPLTLPAEQYAGWLRRTTSGTGLGVLNTTLKLQLVVPDDSVSAALSDKVVSASAAAGALASPAPQVTSVTPIQAATPAVFTSPETGGGGISPIVIVVLIIVAATIIVVIVGVVVLLTMRRGGSAHSPVLTPPQRQNTLPRRPWESDRGFRRSSSLY